MGVPAAFTLSLLSLAMVALTSCRDFIETNPEFVDGKRLFEGDIMLTDEQERALLARKAILNTNNYWKEADGQPLVRYRFNNIEAAREAVIQSAIEYWQQRTCITFQQVNSSYGAHHLIFVKENGCWSYVGRVFPSGQKVSIGNGCTTLGIVAHEIGHAIGFNHEQSRSDRDDFVVIHPENIWTDFENNFAKRTTLTSVPYDYGSLMHYGAKDFSKNKKFTITAKEPLGNAVIGQRNDLSFRDIRMANIIYGCIEQWATKCSGTICNNSGYPGSNCSCVCPPNYEGPSCDIRKGDYLATFLVDNCTEEITTEQTITSPNYPSNYPKGLRCMKFITAPDCHLPKLVFTDFKLHQKNDGSCREKVEIRNNYLVLEEDHCGTDIQAGGTFTGTSTEMILLFDTYYDDLFKGWSADLSFVPNPSCGVTTTPTATTTTTTSTTTTTTTTSFPPPITSMSGPCTFTFHNGYFHWMSPNFGQGNYRESINCSFTAMKPNRILTVHSNVFQLGKKRNCKSNRVLITSINDRGKKLCKNQSPNKKVLQDSAYNIKVNFISKGLNNQNHRGFNITFTETENTACDKTIHLAMNEELTIKSPNWMTKKVAPLCEWYIIGPDDSLINITSLKTRMVPSKRCTKEYLLLNGNEEPSYPSASSRRICDKREERGGLILDSGARIENGMTLIKDSGARIENGMTLIQESGARIENGMTLIQDSGARIGSRMMLGSNKLFLTSKGKKRKRKPRGFKITVKAIPKPA